MRLSFARAGGFANTRLTAEADTDARSLVFGSSRSSRPLTQDEADSIHELFNRSRFFNIRSELKPATGADRFEYVLTADVDGKTHTIQISESGVPTELEELIRFMTRLSLG